LHIDLIDKGHKTMTASTTSDTTRKTRQGAARWAGQMIAGLVLFGLLLFVTAGRLNWIGGWAYLGLNAFTQLLSALLLTARQPEMLAERSEVREGTKGWDRFFTPAILFSGSLALVLVAGLDARFGWSVPVSIRLWAAALAVAFASQMFVLWAMACNPFFALTVRIQSDRAQRAITTGPYRLVRHPGYLGSAIYTLAIPIVLGSWWTFIPAALTVVLIVARTGLEDRTLRAELPGYADYASATRSRLIPGLW
jgi:protein-S-isoprenylcysteine O-methyltransferase Ste14